MLNMNLHEKLKGAMKFKNDSFCLEGEVWKNLKYVEGYENYTDYEISNFGRVRSSNRSKKILKTIPHNKGYLYINLYKDGVMLPSVLVHRLVALAFVENTQNAVRKHVNHIDHIKVNNHFSNLEWVTSLENTQAYHSFKHKKITDEKNRIIRNEQLLKLYKIFKNISKKIIHKK